MRSKVTDLVRDLIITEVWKDKVFDRALDLIPASQMSDFSDLKCYMIVTLLRALSLHQNSKKVTL